MKRNDKAILLVLEEKDVSNNTERTGLIGKEALVRNVYRDKGDGYFSVCVLVDGEDTNRVLSNVKLEMVDRHD